MVLSRVSLGFETVRRPSLYHLFLVPHLSLSFLICVEVEWLRGAPRNHSSDDCRGHVNPVDKLLGEILRTQGPESGRIEKCFR